MLGFQSGENDAGRHPLDIPFPGPWNGLVKIVDVEYEASVGGFIATQILDVRIAAKLDEDAGIRLARQVGRHDGNGSAEKREGRLRHAAVLDREEFGDATGGSGEQNVDGLETAFLHIERAELRPARRFAFFAALLQPGLSCWQTPASGDPPSVLSAIVMTYALIGDEAANAPKDCANGGALAMTGSRPNYRSRSGAAADDGGGTAGVIVAIVVSATITISAPIVISAAIVVVAVLIAIAGNILSVTVVLRPIIAVIGGLRRDCDGGQSQTEDAENRDAKNAFHNYLRLTRWGLPWRSCQAVRTLIARF
jgi:hypothetical protein